MANYNSKNPSSSNAYVTLYTYDPETDIESEVGTVHLPLTALVSAYNAKISKDRLERKDKILGSAKLFLHYSISIDRNISIKSKIFKKMDNTIKRAITF